MMECSLMMVDILDHHAQWLVTLVSKLVKTPNEDDMIVGHV